MARIRPTRRRSSGDANRRGLLLMAGGAVALLTGVGAVAVLAADPPVDNQDCPVGAPSPQTLVLALDTTDNLIAKQPRRTREAVEEALAASPPGSRIAVQEINAVGADEVTPLYEGCLPGMSSNVERNRREAKVWKPIQDALDDLGDRPPAPASPILESLIQIAADPKLHRPGSRLVIVLITDGLQRTAYATAYSDKSWPDPRPDLLAGATVRVVLLRNDRDIDLQPAAALRLKAWLTAASADVQYKSPAWLSIVGKARA